MLRPDRDRRARQALVPWKIESMTALAQAFQRPPASVLFKNLSVFAK
jgi:hypothetical protein